MYIILTRLTTVSFIIRDRILVEIKQLKDHFYRKLMTPKMYIFLKKIYLKTRHSAAKGQKIRKSNVNNYFKYSFNGSIKTYNYLKTLYSNLNIFHF